MKYLKTPAEFEVITFQVAIAGYYGVRHTFQDILVSQNSFVNEMLVCLREQVSRVFEFLTILYFYNAIDILVIQAECHAICSFH